MLFLRFVRFEKHFARHILLVFGRTENGYFCVFQIWRNQARCYSSESEKFENYYVTARWTDYVYINGLFSRNGNVYRKRFVSLRGIYLYRPGLLLLGRRKWISVNRTYDWLSRLLTENIRRWARTHIDVMYGVQHDIKLGCTLRKTNSAIWFVWLRMCAWGARLLVTYCGIMYITDVDDCPSRITCICRQ